MPRGRNDYETAQIQGRLWTPAVLRPALWLDAADLSTITISTGVSEWRDKSGNARHATQATGASQPTLTANTPSALNALVFDGSDDWMGTATASYAVRTVLFAALNTENPINPTGTFPVYNSLRTSPNSNKVTASDIDFGIARPISGDNIDNYAGNSTSANLNGAAVSSLANWNDFNTGVAHPAGWFVASTTISATASGTKTWCIGADAFGASSGCIAHRLGEFLVLSSAASFAELCVAEGYLSWKWGVRLAADHPYANRPPLIGD